MHKWIVIFSFFILGFVKGIDPHDFYLSIMELDEVIILDVRLWEDYASDRIINSIWAGEMSELEKVVENIDKNRSIFLYCDYDDRSSVVSKILKKKGFKRIFKLEGGLMDWKNMGFPVDTITFADSLKYNATFNER